MTRPADLPDFEKPPVTEVALSIQFAALERFRTVHAGLLWREFRKKFPTVIEHGQIPAQFETFGLDEQSPQVQLEMLTVPPVPRYWFISADDAELIQFQPDRFVHNWRKRSPEDEYPRYEHIVEEYKSEIDRLAGFLHENQLGHIVPNQSEVTYINQIALPEPEMNTWKNFDRIFTVWRSKYNDDMPLDLDTVRFNLRYILTGEDAKPYGRLHIEAKPGKSPSSGLPIAVLTITARGIPAEATIEGAFSAIELGRLAVVRGFASVTTPEMHNFWGRKDVKRPA